MGEFVWIRRILVNEVVLCRVSERENIFNKLGVGSMDKGRSGSRCVCGRGRGR